MWKTCPRFPIFRFKNTPCDWYTFIIRYFLTSISSVLYAFSYLYKIGYCLFGIYCLASIFMFFDHKHACISPLTIFKCGAKLFEKQKSNDSGVFAWHVTCRSGNLPFIVTIHNISFLCGLSQTRWEVKKKCANIYALWKFMTPSGCSCILRVIYYVSGWLNIPSYVRKGFFFLAGNGNDREPLK